MEEGKLISLSSVFEYVVDPAQWTVLEASFLAITDEEKDSRRIYQLGSN